MKDKFRTIDLKTFNPGLFILFSRIATVIHVTKGKKHTGFDYSKTNGLPDGVTMAYARKSGVWYSISREQMKNWVAYLRADQIYSNLPSSNTVQVAMSQAFGAERFATTEWGSHYHFHESAIVDLVNLKIKK